MSIFPYAWYYANFIEPNNPLINKHKLLSGSHSSLDSISPVPGNLDKHSTQGIHSEKETIGPFIDKDGFQVSLDVNQFGPHEIVVKAIANQIIIECKHDERKDDHGYLFRHFIRRFNIPKECNIDLTRPIYTPDGHLIIKSPLLESSSERIIAVCQNDEEEEEEAAAVQHKEKPKRKEKKK